MAATIKTWDPLVRLFHWTLVVSFAVCYFTQEEAYELHLDSGYVVLGAIVVRIIWGVIGTKHARFSDFVYLPGKVITYFRQFLRGKAKRYIGHNPAGGAMVVAMLITLLMVALSGVALDAAENRAGPLADTDLFMYLDVVQDTHIISTNVMLGLISLHLLGVLASSHMHRENLVRAMITGKKTNMEN